MGRSGQRSSSCIKIVATVVVSLLVIMVLLVTFVRRSGSGRSSVSGSEVHRQAGESRVPYKKALRHDYKA